MQVSLKIMGLGTIAMIFTLLCCGTIKSAHGNYVCDYYDCGMGTCKDSSDFPFFRCECEYGWRRPNADEESLSYLPCVIPNCTMSYSCTDSIYPQAPPPVYRGGLSPCDWDVCGAGKCVKQPHGTHTCLCDQGFENLMNWTIGYCVTECQLGSDCAAEGVTIAGSSSKSVNPPASGTDDQALDSSPASGSATSGCARLASLFITSVIVFVSGWKDEHWVDLRSTYRFRIEVWIHITLLCCLFVRDFLI